MLEWGCLGGTGGRAVCWSGGVWVGLVVGQCVGVVVQCVGVVVQCVGVGCWVRLEVGQCVGVGCLGGTGGRAVCWGGGVGLGRESVMS